MLLLRRCLYALKNIKKQIIFRAQPKGALIDLSPSTSITKGAFPNASCSIIIEASFSISIVIIFLAVILAFFTVMGSQIKASYKLSLEAEKLAMIITEDHAGKDGEVDAGVDVAGIASEVDGEEDVILSKMSAHRLAFLPGAIGQIVTKQEACYRKWTGRTISGDEDLDGDEYVYVADAATVYHTNENCTHLKLKYSLVPLGSVSSMRNRKGGIYYPCEKCGSNCGDMVYVSPDGERYHSDENCSGLTRHYKRVKKSEINLPPCRRCGGVK